jgi:ligand-binding sensor domain-containing protein
MRNPWWKSILQFLIGISFVVGIGLIALFLWPRAEPPSGWKITRPPQDIMALAEYKGALWVGGRDGLVSVDLETGELNQNIDLEMDSDYVTALRVDPSEEILWIGHINGLTRLVGGTWQTFTQADGLPENQVLSLIYGMENDLWIGTTGGLTRYEAGSFHAAPAGNPLQNIAISTLYLDSQERLWIGNGHTTVGGLAMYDGVRWHQFGVQDGLAHPMVNAIEEDTQGAIWIGTGFASLGGASIYDNDRFKTLRVEDGLAGPKVRSIYLDKDGSIWVGSEYDGVARQVEEGWAVYTPDDGLSGWEIKAMLQDSLGNFWLGTENGLTRIDHTIWRDLESVQID